ncbi:cytoplasmic 60S subunit biogenesis factor REI1 homolog 2-like [Impatiens glandulifera]|uniref:cytoplasmic 60S subunit biogenesis factor REI1 homolog 2-like n=1 Tax=Impatiens glandulifera TaxID=253017 RepID=UPI001FB13256|nr:cytoplasmic 60S subunit biogenesis factor REI1 homolog 2-like [Impatiens glandulifera]
MSVFTCNACNKELQDESEQKLHYKSEWHRYNLKRKVAGVPGVTETLFLSRQAALAVGNNKPSATPMLFCCGLCNKGYRSSQAHAQHLKSRSHVLLASQETGRSNVERAIIKPLPPRVVNNHLSQQTDDDEDEEESEWEEVDSDEDNLTEAVGSLKNLKVDEDDDEHVEMEEDDEEETDDILLDPLCCFMCDLEHDTLESCMVHMHKKHGFFIPDIEYLKDPKGFLTYLGLKVKKDLLCLYCNHRRFPFASLEAVRKHMEAKSHCKVHYGDGGDDEEAELEDFYDYSSSYMNEDGMEDDQQQIMTADEMKNNVELGSGGSELVITQKRTADGVVSTKMLGSREFLRYYRQKPKPTPANHAVIAALASRYRSMGLVTTLSREKFVKMKVLRQMNRSGVEQMRSKMGMKSNVINNLPSNVPY